MLGFVNVKMVVKYILFYLILDWYNVIYIICILMEYLFNINVIYVYVIM